MSAEHAAPLQLQAGVSSTACYLGTLHSPHARRLMRLSEILCIAVHLRAPQLCICYDRYLSELCCSTVESSLKRDALD